MPALILHMTLAQRVVAEASSEDSFDATTLLEAARAHPSALILGSILPDLPYHARFLHQMARHLSKRGYLLSEWGDVMHTRKTGTLALAMLCHVVRSRLPADDRQQGLSLIAGYLCHHAADTVVHPAINRLVDRHRAEREAAGERVRPTDVIHSELERLQNLLYHHRLLGHDITGTPYPRQLVRQMAGVGLIRPALPDPLFRTFRAAALETHGRAPSTAELRDWLWGVTVYCELLSSPLGRLTEGLKGEPEELARQHYDGPGIDLATPLDQSVRATLDAWAAAEAVLCAERITAEGRSVFLQTVRDVDLGSGA